MKSLNKAFERPFFLIVFLMLGAGCSGGGSPNNQGGNQVTPAPSATPTGDPLLAAQMSFKEKVWPSLQNNRCEYCHNFDVERSTFMPGTLPSGHPDRTGAPATCIGCHNAALLGFSSPPASNDWQPAPDADKWNKSSNPNDVRAHIILRGPDLYKHILGEDAPLVAWAFFNGPNVGPGAGQIHAGKVPVVGGSNQEFPSGQIPDSDLLNWNTFKANVEQWMCMEAKIPGAPNLGLPPTVVCP